MKPFTFKEKPLQWIGFICGLGLLILVPFGGTVFSFFLGLEFIMIHGAQIFKLIAIVPYRKKTEEEKD